MPDEGHFNIPTTVVLEGTYKSEHLFALRQSLEAFDFYRHQLQVCDQEIEARYESLPPAPPGDGTTPPQAKTQKRRKNQAHFDLAASLYRTAGVDLTAIDGIDALTTQTILSEIGLDMSRWPTVKHFASWLGLSPNNEISGGKVLRTRTKKTKNRATTALRLAAQSLHGSDSALGGFYRRLRAQHGPAKAITATAHKLARIIYYMLRDRIPYQDPGAQRYEQQYNNTRRESYAISRAKPNVSACNWSHSQIRPRMHRHIWHRPKFLRSAARNPSDGRPVAREIPSFASTQDMPRRPFAALKACSSE